MRLKYFHSFRFVLVLIYFCAFAGKVFATQADPILVKSELFYTQGKYDDAIKILAARLKLAKEKKEVSLQVVLYNSIGKSYSQLGKSIEALANYQKAATLADELNDQNSLGKIEKNIGALYEEQKNFDEALVHYKDAETIAKKIKDESLLADIYNNSGIVYEQQLKYPLALETYGKALTIYQKLNKPDRIALTLNNKGIVYKYLRKYEEAISYYKKSLTYSKLLGDKFFVAANLNNIGNVYGMLKNYPEAINYNLQSLKIAESIGATNIIVEALSSLVQHYAGSGDYKRAYEWNQKFTKVNADYINLESTRALAQQQTLYQTEKKNRQISEFGQKSQISFLKLKAQKLLIQKQSYQILFITLFLLLSLALGYFLYHQKQKKQRKIHLNAIKEVQNTERSRIAQDVHDDIGSGLSKITLIAASATKKLDAIGQGSSEITTISQVSKDLVDNIRDLIWVLNPENATLDNLIARIREYCSDYLDACTVSADLDIQDQIPCLKISQQVQRNIFLVIKEALHNCAKHANCDSIAIKLTYLDQLLVIIITDNGKGFELEQLKSKGNGLRNMRHRIESVNGEFTSTSQLNIGTVISIKIAQKELQSVGTNNTKM